MNINWAKNVGSWAYREDFLEFLESPYMSRVLKMIMRSSETVYPSKKNVFKAFTLCPPTNLKVVILGQDPYHDGSATGLAFANDNETLKISPSLRRILACVEREYNTLEIDKDVSLQTWANQGVLLLNTALTVEKGKAGSHTKMWKIFTKFVIKYIAENFPGTIFMLWGAHAQSFQKIDDVDIADTCHVLTCEHPVASQYRGITEWNCDNFKEANKILKEQNGKEYCIEW